MEIAYIAREFSRGKRVATVKILQGSYLEPTWGDVAKANLIATGINSTNQTQLLTGFGAAIAIKDLQLCRNASAHLNKDLLMQINTAKVRYSNTAVVHPSDLMYWIDPITSDFLWKTWLDEMLVCSRHAIT